MAPALLLLILLGLPALAGGAQPDLQLAEAAAMRRTVRPVAPRGTADAIVWQLTQTAWVGAGRSLELVIESEALHGQQGVLTVTVTWEAAPTELPAVGQQRGAAGGAWRDWPPAEAAAGRLLWRQAGFGAAGSEGRLLIGPLPARRLLTYTVHYGPAPIGDADSDDWWARAWSGGVQIGGPPPPDEPLIVARSVRRMTTTRKAQRTVHERWHWDFDDGNSLEDSDVVSAVTHRYAAAGTYTVRATAWSNAGDRLRDLSFVARVDADSLEQTFVAASIEEPVVEITVYGPHLWLARLPAPYLVDVRVEPVPHMQRQAVRVEPGRRFWVQWEYPGRYRVLTAVTVDTSYAFDERTIRIINTYVESVGVEALTPALVD